MSKEPETPLLAVDKVSKCFTRGLLTVQALESISFRVLSGEFVALVGPSGSGKSTLLRLAGGLIPTDTGKVTFAGQPLREPHSDIGVVFQKNNLMPWWTVVQNVLLPLRVENDDLGEAERTTALELIEAVGLAGFENAYPKQLSGGMNQRVALARALIQRPKLLLMDEPFGALDALTRERLNLELLKLHADHAMTTLMVTHDIAEAVFLADRILVLSERPGRLLGEVLVGLPRPRQIPHMATPLFSHLIFQVRQVLGTVQEAVAPLP